MDYTIWFGPVSSAQVQNAILGGSTLKVVQVKNNATAQPFLQRWRDSAGNYVPGMLKDLKIDPSTLKSLFIGSFSAGHNLAKQVTRSLADRDAITGLILSDSEQSGWADAKHVKAVIPEGYYNYAREAATGTDKLFVATAGTGTSSEYAPSSATMRDIVQKLIESGVSVANGSSLVPDTLTPKPVSVQSAGNFVSLDYQGSISHEDHVLKLAANVWQQVVTPWYARQGQGGGVAINPLNQPGASQASALGGVPSWMIVGGGLALAYYLLARKQTPNV